MNLFETESILSGSSCTGTGYAVDPNDCSTYYQCVNGVYVQGKCPSGLNWNLGTSTCDWAHNVDCTGNPAPPSTTAASGPTTTKGPATTTVPPQTGPGPLVTQSEFISAAQTKGGNPSMDYYNGYIASLSKAGITTRREAILFLAHAVWETVGFKYTKEVYCQTNLAACAQAYPNQHGGLPGIVYYGRGVMQLTWDYNYAAASLYLFGDDRLIQNPDVVGDDPEMGWATVSPQRHEH